MAVSGTAISYCVHRLGYAKAVCDTAIPPLAPSSPRSCNGGVRHRYGAHSPPGRLGASHLVQHTSLSNSSNQLFYRSCVRHRYLCPSSPPGLRVPLGAVGLGVIHQPLHQVGEIHRLPLRPRARHAQDAPPRCDVLDALAHMERFAEGDSSQLIHILSKGTAEVYSWARAALYPSGA
jgi:hypothetical protein